MRSDSNPNAQKKPSFIEEARRRQIIETAIETIADKGFTHASLAEIARNAGISKGVISYHFTNKEELIEEILLRLVREPAAFVKPRVDAAQGARKKLEAYVTANIEFMRSNRKGYVAFVDLWGSTGASDHRQRFKTDAYEPSRRYITRIIENGLESGEVQPGTKGRPDARAMASVIQSMLDGLMLHWVFDPTGVDLEKCRETLLAMMAHFFQEGEAK